MIHIDHYAYLSRLKATDPRQKLAFTMTTMLVCIALANPYVSVIVLLAMMGYSVIFGGIPLGFFVRILLVPAAFLTIGILTILINLYPYREGLIAAVPIAGLWLGISPGSLMTSINLFLKALGAASCLYALSLTTPMVAMLGAFRRLGPPSLFVDLMGLIYRFIFVLLDTSAVIITAQQSRLGYHNAATAFRSFATMLTMLLTRVHKRSDDLYTALESRGYQGELTVLEEAFVNSRAVVAGTIILNLILVGVKLVTG